jgi:hypothetical protein
LTSESPSELERPQATSATLRFDDLCDTVSAALIHLRDRGLLSLGEEFRREERRHLVYRSRAGGPSIRELYEDV